LLANEKKIKLFVGCINKVVVVVDDDDDIYKTRQVVIVVVVEPSCHDRQSGKFV
jgi:hypothetical protein